MRTTTIILGLATLTLVIGLYVSGSPEQGEKLARMQQDIAFKGEGREMALLVLALGLAAFIGYLTVSRRQ
ncbi:hypothetical protein [Salinarimonas soli]|uniref:Uncharacterized protein n=1 Tax=Salinarimonas soli TaxID=1638099 RepID=A0A5B2VDK7_9HYPH|nr:hypothetical protein [Salinarimonas soli]KAA2236177.1 hypothetical protein F0L46_15815 [Salinarimonas soli]